jgi:hypothetical protein
MGIVTPPPSIANGRSTSRASSRIADHVVIETFTQRGSSSPPSPSKASTEGNRSGDSSVRTAPTPRPADVSADESSFTSPRLKYVLRRSTTSVRRGGRPRR